MANLNITYLGHSGFLMEWDTCYFLFDYYNGKIPSLDSSKMLVIFVSHSHEDHFNPAIFKLYNEHPRTTYVMSSDIRLQDRTELKYGITEDLYRRITVAYPNQEYKLTDEGGNSIDISTLKSTDRGVAFIIRYNGKTVYHSGDLNLWVWKGEDKQYNNDMRARFNKEMSKLKGIDIDIAFAPLDPRQEELYGLGIDALLETAKVNYVFPMHFWDKPEVILKYLKENESKNIIANIINITEQGQSWSIEI